MEKISLTEKQKEKIINEWNCGDIYGIEMLYKILKEEKKIKDNNMNFTIYDLIICVKYMNTLKVMTEMWDDLEDIATEIDALYDKIKNKLFNKIENKLF